MRGTKREADDSEEVKVPAPRLRAASVQPEFDWDTLDDFEGETISILIVDRVSRIFTVYADIGRMGHHNTPRLRRYNIWGRSRQQAWALRPGKSSAVILSSV